MIVIQRKADGRYLQRRDHGYDHWTLNKHEAKQYAHKGTAKAAFLAAVKRDWWDDDDEQNTRYSASVHIDYSYQFVRFT